MTCERRGELDIGSRDICHRQGFEVTLLFYVPRRYGEPMHASGDDGDDGDHALLVPDEGTRRGSGRRDSRLAGGTDDSCDPHTTGAQRDR